MKILNLTFIIVYQCVGNLIAENQVVIIGTERKAEFEEIIHFFAEHWKIDGVNFVVIFKDNLPSDYCAYIEYQEVEAYQVKNVIIKMNRRLSISKLKVSLVHELIHAKQFYYKELIKVDEVHFIWKGQVFQNIRLLPYRQRPWEQEALRDESILYRLYAKHQRNNELVATK